MCHWVGIEKMSVLVRLAVKNERIEINCIHSYRVTIYLSHTHTTHIFTVGIATYSHIVINTCK